jgi:hypothetical protein
VLLNENPQFCAGIHAGQVCASFLQCTFCVLVVTKEDRLAQDLAGHHDKRQFQERQERGLMRFEDFGELCRTKPRQLKRQRIWWFNRTNSARPVGVGAASQPWIVKGGQSSLLMHIGETVNASLCTPTKS